MKKKKKKQEGKTDAERYCRSNFGLAWHKRFLVLKDETSERGPLLELYTSQEEALSQAGTAPCLRSPCCRLCFDLAQTVHVGFTSDSKRFPNALVLVCQGRSPLVLAAQDELGSRSWLLALGLIAHKASSQHGWRFMCKKASEQAVAVATSVAYANSLENSSSAGTNASSGVGVRRQSGSTFDGESENSLDAVLIPPPLEYGDGCLDMLFSRERFSVSVNPSEASERVGLRGDYQLVILGHSVGLLRPGAPEPFLVWPVTCIRQYKHELLLAPGARNNARSTTLVTIEVGRRCCTGEGTFQFRTNRGQEVIRELKRAVALWSARKAALASWCQSRAAAQRSSCLRLGRSAPATPSLSMPPAWRRQPESPETRGGSCGDARTTADLNYVLPAFERSSSSLSNDSALSSPRLTRPFQSDPGEHLAMAVDEDDADGNYVRVAAVSHAGHKNRVSFRNAVKSPTAPTPIPGVPARKVQDLRRAEGYIEVLPT